jgi:hypothetical protein
MKVKFVVRPFSWPRLLGLVRNRSPRTPRPTLTGGSTLREGRPGRRNRGIPSGHSLETRLRRRPQQSRRRPPRKTRSDAALAEAREGVRLEPENPNTHRALGSVFRDKGDIDGAEREYQKALRLKHAFTRLKQGRKLLDLRGPVGD